MIIKLSDKEVNKYFLKRDIFNTTRLKLEKQDISIKMIRLELLFITIFVFVLSTEAQLSTNEVLKNVTECDVRKDINIDCGTDAVIAVHTLQYAYNVNCETTCCTYSKRHCFVYAETNDVKEILRICSGQKSCIVSINTDKTEFTTCSLGIKDISYVFLQYYCIAETQILTICSNGKLLSSDNNPVYLTNEGYPGVTTGTTSCSCSFELFSCNTNINLYINDADLYSDTSNCEQSITFNDPDNQTLTTIGCEDHYKNQIEKESLGRHYVKIDFTSNSTENLEGYFFIGFDSSAPDVSFQLTCSSQSETWCTDCGTVPTITNGNTTLHKEDDDSFGATASIKCDSGYKTDTPTITCQANGTWLTPECTEKPACLVDQWRCDNGDCISNASTCDNVPDCADESDEQSCSGLICPEGLKSCPHSNGSIVCVNDGFTCECSSVPSIDNGIVSLNENSKIGAVADISCNKGYNPSNLNVTCLETGSWESATCSPKDCGALPSLGSGHYELVNAAYTVFGASAKVVCDSGYTSKKSIITCQSSGQWGTAVCSERANPATSPSKKKDSGLNIIIIIVIVLVALFLLGQLVAMCYFQCKIHNIRKKVSDGDNEIHKRILMTIGGSVPIIGLIPIYLTGKEFYRDVYKETHKHKGTNLGKPYGVSDSGFGSHETVKGAEVGNDNPDLTSKHNLGTELSDIDIVHNSPEPTAIVDPESDGKMPENKNTDIKENVPESKSTITSDKPTEHDGRQHDNHLRSTITRGISASLFPDSKDDMAFGPGRYSSTNKHHVEYNHDAHKHHHYSKDVEKKRAEYKPIMEEARKEGHHAELYLDKLYIDNRLYHGEEVTHLTNTHYKPMHDTEGHHKRKHEAMAHHKPTHVTEGHHKGTHDTGSHHKPAHEGEAHHKTGHMQDSNHVSFF